METRKKGITPFIGPLRMKLRGFIPHKVPNKVVLGALEVLSKIGKAFNKLRSRAVKGMIEQHREDNIYKLAKGISDGNGGIKKIYSTGDYIENQSEWKEVKLGKSNMGYAGCEIMAVYNALKALGKKVSEQTIADLIAAFERGGIVLDGRWGTSPYAIKNYFKGNGYNVEATTVHDTEIINKIGENSDTVIVSVYNNKDDIFGMIHTVSITKEVNGTYSVHNAGGNYNHRSGIYEAKKDYETLQEAINDISDRNPLSISVIGISV